MHDVDSIIEHAPKTSHRDAGYAQGPDPLSLISVDKLRRQLEVNVTAQLQVTQVSIVLSTCHLGF